MKLSFAPSAEADLRDIARYIARENPARARSYVRELREKCASLREFPLSGAPRPELRPDLRSKPYGRYSIIYAVTEQGIRVERVLHSARDWAGVFDDRPA